MVVKTTQCNSNVSIENCQAYVIEEMRNYFLNKSNRLEQEEIKTLIKESEIIQEYYNNITKFINDEIDLDELNKHIHKAIDILNPGYVGCRCCICHNYGDVEYIVSLEDVYCESCFGDKLNDMHEDYIDKHGEHHDIATISDCVDMTDCFDNKVKEELPF